MKSYFHIFLYNIRHIDPKINRIEHIFFSIPEMPSVKRIIRQPTAKAKVHSKNQKKWPPFCKFLLLFTGNLKYLLKKSTSTFQKKYFIFSRKEA